MMSILLIWIGGFLVGFGLGAIINEDAKPQSILNRYNIAQQRVQKLITNIKKINEDGKEQRSRKHFKYG